jgi:hypothetical protein
VPKPVAATARNHAGARAFDTLLRYRGTTLAELWRALRALKVLQAEEAQLEPTVTAAPRALPRPCEMPIEPERRGILRESEIAPAAKRPDPLAEAGAVAPQGVTETLPGAIAPPCVRVNQPEPQRDKGRNQDAQAVSPRSIPWPKRCPGDRETCCPLRR